MNSRNKGHNYERQIRKELRERFYPDCETSRYVSKYVDDVEKTDLVNTGMIRFQLKAMEKFPNFFDVLDSMPDDERYNVIFNKRNRKGEIVVMSKEDFYEILNILKSNNIKL
jgi:hypothetical protein